MNYVSIYLCLAWNYKLAQATHFAFCNSLSTLVTWNHGRRRLQVVSSLALANLETHLVPSWRPWFQVTSVESELQKVCCLSTTNNHTCTTRTRHTPNKRNARKHVESSKKFHLFCRWTEQQEA